MDFPSYNTYPQNNNYHYNGNLNQPHPSQNQYWQNQHITGHHNQPYQQQQYHGGNHQNCNQNNNYNRQNHHHQGYHQKNSYQNSRQHHIRQPAQNVQCRCEPCERDFTSQSALIAHQKQHVKCEDPNCNYIASSKAVKLHFIQNHEKGRFRIVLTTPEEIQKWRDERKKNWPSKLNIERKKAAKEKKTIDGNIIETKEFVYQPNSVNNQRKRSNNAVGVTEKFVKKVKREDTNNNSDVSSSKQSALTLLKNYSVDSSSDEEVLKPYDAIKKESVADGDSCSPPTTAKKNTPVKQSQQENRKEDRMIPNNSKEMEEGELEETDIDEKSEIVKQELHGERDLPARFKDKIQTEDKRRHKNKRDGRKKQNQVQQPPRKQVSLLEMLLAKEIRHERNVILQCVKYIVQNNYFDHSTSST